MSALTSAGTGHGRLVNEYIPALFVVGNAVRNCNWAGRDSGTALDARDAMRFSACMLVSLSADRAKHTEHLRDVCIALMMWQEWHSGLLGAMFSEEKPEALLGRFARALTSHPGAVEAQDLEDVFLQVRTGKPGVHELHARGPTQALVHKVTVRMRDFVASQADGVRFVPWAKARMCTAVHGHLSPLHVPLHLGSGCTFEHCKECLGYFL